LKFKKDYIPNSTGDQGWSQALVLPEAKGLVDWLDIQKQHLDNLEDAIEKDIVFCRHKIFVLQEKCAGHVDTFQRRLDKNFEHLAELNELYRILHDEGIIGEIDRYRHLLYQGGYDHVE